MALNGSPGPGAAAPEPGSRSDRMRMRAAWMYYVEEMTQNDIALALGIGRVSVVRLLAEARARSEVRISVTGPLADLVRIERALEAHFGLDRAIVVPAPGAGEDPAPVISAAIGAYLSETVRSGMRIGVGWGRTLHDSLPFIEPRALETLSVVSLLGGIAEARRFNPAEFAWRFAQTFGGDAFLLAAPAIVDSPDTKRALIERCGLRPVLDMAADLDLAVLSVGGIAGGATTYRTGFIAEGDRRSLQEAGAVGDLLFHFMDAEGRLVDHPINRRIMSADMAALRRAGTRVMASGGAQKVDALHASFALVRPSVLITDETTANALLTRAPVLAAHEVA